LRRNRHCLPSGSRLRTVTRMGICCVEGIWRAWIPDAANPAAGEMAHGYTEDEVLAKLDG
jgi:hypothetical protein